MTEPRCKYRAAVVMDCDYGGIPHVLCCLDHLAYTDGEFATKLNNNPDMLRLFQLLTNKHDDRPVSTLRLNKADGMAALFIEFALLNRARFACVQKGVFADHHSSIVDNSIVDNDTTKEAMHKWIGIELKYIDCQ